MSLSIIIAAIIIGSSLIVHGMSLSIIIAAIIIGSSLIVHVNIGPFIFGYPILGIIGYIIAILLGFGLIISIIRSGKWK